MRQRYPASGCAGDVGARVGRLPSSHPGHLSVTSPGAFINPSLLPPVPAGAMATDNDRLFEMLPVASMALHNVERSQASMGIREISVWDWLSHLLTESPWVGYLSSLTKVSSSGKSEQECSPYGV